MSEPLIWKDGDSGPTTETAAVDAVPARAFTDWRDMVIADQAAEIAALSASLAATNATLTRTESLLFKRTDALSDVTAKFSTLNGQLRSTQRSHALQVASLHGQIDALQPHVVSERFTVFRQGDRYTFMATPETVRSLDAQYQKSPGYAKAMWDQIQAGLEAGSIVKDTGVPQQARGTQQAISRQQMGEVIEA